MLKAKRPRRRKHDTLQTCPTCGHYAWSHGLNKKAKMSWMCQNKNCLYPYFDEYDVDQAKKKLGLIPSYHERLIEYFVLLISSLLYCELKK